MVIASELCSWTGGREGEEKEKEKVGVWERRREDREISSVLKASSGHRPLMAATRPASRLSYESAVWGRRGRESGRKGAEDEPEERRRGGAVGREMERGKRETEGGGRDGRRALRAGAERGRCGKES